MSYFDFTALVSRTTARAEQVNAIFQAIKDAFGLLPSEERLKQGRVTYGTDSGTAGAYVVALPHAPASYTEGLEVVFKPLAANSGASTINVNGLGVKALRRWNGDATITGDILAGAIVEARYDGSVFRLLASSSTADVTAAQGYASNAATSASTAGTYATNAATSASNAATSATAAANAVANTNSVWCGSATGDGNTIVLTPSPAIAAYSSGLTVRFKVTATNTDVVTVNVSGLGAKSMRSGVGVPLTPNALLAGVVAEATYDGTEFRLSDVSTIRQGKHTIWLPAASMYGRTTNGAGVGSTETTTNKVMARTLDFDQTTQEYAQFAIAMPKSWDRGTLSFVAHWTADSGDGGVVWSLQAVAVSDGESFDAAFGTAQTVTDSIDLTFGTDPAHPVKVTPESSTITVAGSPAAGDMIYFQISRATGNGSDTLAADAKLIGISLFYVVAAGTDA